MKSADNTPKLKKIVFWVTTIVIAIAYFITGLGNLFPFPHIAREMAHLGYPPYFLKIIGTWKILAAIFIIIPNFPRVKEWIYAGMIFDLTGAALSRYSMGDPLPMIIIPLAISGIVTVNYIIRHGLQKNAQISLKTS